MTKLKFSSLEGAEQNFAMLDLIPDTHAWIKDAQGRFVYGNSLFFKRFGFSFRPNITFPSTVSHGKSADS